MRKSEISSNLDSISSRIRAAAQDCGRDPKGIQLLAVSKTFPPLRIEEAFSAGQLLFGENRIQEALVKIPDLKGLPLRWHFIGHLQSNKVRKAVGLFDVIETVDTEKLARRLDRACGEVQKSLQVYLQVNVGREPQKTGFPAERVPPAVEVFESLPNLKLEGLMAIPPYDRDPEASRPYFREMAQLLEKVNASRAEPLRGLSMGMSHDFEVAIQEGATLVRVGTAIFGPRRRK